MTIDVLGLVYDQNSTTNASIITSNIAQSRIFNKRERGRGNQQKTSCIPGFDLPVDDIGKSLKPQLGMVSPMLSILINVEVISVSEYVSKLINLAPGLLLLL